MWCLLLLYTKIAVPLPLLHRKAVFAWQLSSWFNQQNPHSTSAAAQYDFSLGNLGDKKSLSMETKVHVKYNSRNLTPSEWLWLLTLCLLPLITHIWAGAPRYAILSGKDPKWHDRITHLNPTSIFWRYYAIVSRRARSSRWTSADMAATNTAFWVENGWDGSEHMMIKSRAYCTRLPEKNHALLLSETGVKTIVVTFQGVQAIWEFIIAPRSFTKSPGAEALSLPSLFMPFAMLGLLRLPATLWLSDDGAYAKVGCLLDVEDKPSTTVRRRKIPTSIKLVASYMVRKALTNISAQN